MDKDLFGTFVRLLKIVVLVMLLLATVDLLREDMITKIVFFGFWSAIFAFGWLMNWIDRKRS